MQELKMRGRGRLRAGAWIGLLLGVTLSASAWAKDPRVVVAEARQAEVVRQVPLTGTVASPKVARLSAEVSGQVARVNVEVGDRVKRGDVLLQLDDEIEQLILEASRAATQQARAELADAERRYADAQRLRQQNSISKNEIQLRRAEVEIDRAALQRQIAEEKRQEARLRRHTVAAPFAGAISERMAEVGEWIEPGGGIFTLVAIDKLRIDFQVPQEFYPDIDEQTDISVTLDALPGKTFDGAITAVVPVSDPSARTFLIHVVLEKADVAMTPGMSVHGTLRLNTDRQGVVVSRDALLRYPDGRVTVWRVTRQNGKATVSEQRVTTGLSFDGKVSVVEGLEPGEVVVVQGNESLQEGQSVRIANQR